jgi:hypothetical protein
MGGDAVMTAGDTFLTAGDTVMTGKDRRHDGQADGAVPRNPKKIAKNFVYFFISSLHAIHRYWES